VFDRHADEGQVEDSAQGLPTRRLGQGLERVGDVPPSDVIVRCVDEAPGRTPEAVPPVIAAASAPVAAQKQAAGELGVPPVRLQLDLRGRAEVSFRFRGD
jgi:hypothetical protein